jgi:hypothetical protein
MAPALGLLARARPTTPPPQSAPPDIGIPSGPAEEGIRGLLKAHDPKITKPESSTKRRYES